MKCVICRHGETGPGTTTVTLERDQLTLVVKSVPALICANCGEDYFEEATTARLLSLLEEAAQVGVQVEVRRYAAPLIAS